MKKLQYIIIWTIILGFVSCDSLLEEEPDSFISPGRFYNTEADATAAINSVYDNLGNLYGGDNYMWVATEFGTDDSKAGPGVNNAAILQIDNYTHSSVNDRLDQIWRVSYSGINRANTVLDRIPLITNIKEKTKVQILGEAKFLRALFYFNLVRLFGDVPLILKSTEQNEGLLVTRTSKEEVYNQIIADLKDAETDLPGIYTDQDIGRATQDAAKGLLTKVYLTRQEWQQAYDKAKEVINSKNKAYGLWDNYIDAFKPENENGKESIFEVQFQSGINEFTRIMIFTLPRSTGLFNGNDSWVPDPDILKSYDINDIRKTQTYYTQFTKDGKTVKFSEHITKHIDPVAINGNTIDAGTNYHILRYPDVLLMYAEAANELGGKTTEVLDYLNKTRNRAKLLNSTITDKDLLRDAILNERRFELAFEGHRWFDLVRMGRLVSTLRAKGNTNIQDFHVLFPIPQRDIDINPNLKQNIGY